MLMQFDRILNENPDLCDHTLSVPTADCYSAAFLSNDFDSKSLITTKLVSRYCICSPEDDNRKKNVNQEGEK